jgi:hypothetical protein
MRDNTEIWERAKQLFREPIDIALWRALRKLASPVAEIGIVHFFECDLRIGLPQVRPIPGVIPREAFESDLHLLDGIENDFQRKADALERFRRGDRWFVGIDQSNGKLTNYRWVASVPTLIPELQSNIVPRPGEVFIYALYTVPEYRRLGIDSFTRRYTYDLLYRTSGVEKVLATIFAGNHASLRASRHFLKEIGRVSYITLHRGGTHLIKSRNPNMPTLEQIGGASNRWLNFRGMVRPMVAALLTLAPLLEI